MSKDVYMETTHDKHHDLHHHDHHLHHDIEELLSSAEPSQTSLRNIAMKTLIAFAAFIVSCVLIGVLFFFLFGTGERAAHQKALQDAHKP
ncbi:unnamed protein product, partial [Mesorhabditis spiculigera]